MEYWTQYKKETDLGIDFERPDQKTLAGRLLVLGGQANSFFVVANAINTAEKEKIGDVKALMPDSLSKKIPNNDRVVFLPSDKSGGFSETATSLALNSLTQADAMIVIGDMGKNSETIKFLDELLIKNEKDILLMRDAVDLAISGDNVENWLEKGNIVLFVSIAQFKKILKAVYYPKVINITAPVMQLIEVVHKFTLSYSLTLVIPYGGFIILAKNGKVMSVKMNQTKYDMLTIFNGELATKMMKLKMWNVGKDNLSCFIAGCID